MRKIKYTDDGKAYRCLEHLKETFLDFNPLHAGREICEPSHICSGARSEYIIHFIFSGKGFYAPSSRTMHQLSAGQMFLIHPGMPVIYGSDSVDPWHYGWVGFSGIKADMILKQCGFTSNRLILPMPKQDMIMECINNIMDCKKLTYANDLRRKAWMLTLFAELIDFHNHLPSGRSRGGMEQSGSTNAYVNLAVEYIKNYYKEGINVSDIAEHLGISRAYLNYAFQKEFGLSIQKFLIDFRMHKAANLLVSTFDTVKEISMSIGYEDQLTFSKAFKKKFGKSPKNYRMYKAAAVLYNEKQLEDHAKDFSD